MPKSARPFETQVERRDPLRDPRRVVERRRCLHDAVAEADALGALRDRGEEHLGRAGVAVLLEEVVLDLPHVVDAEPVGELALLERVLDQRVLGVFLPRARELVLVEDPELHAGPSAGRTPALRRRCGRASTSASCSAVSTARSDAIATSSWSRRLAGREPLERAGPGCISTRTQRLVHVLGREADHLVAEPGDDGISTIRDRMSSGQRGRPTNEYTTIVIDHHREQEVGAAAHVLRCRTAAPTRA